MTDRIETFIAAAVLTAMVRAARDRMWDDGVRALIAAERYDAALHALEQAPDARRAAALRAELLLQVGELDAAEAAARAAGGLATACLAEVMLERGEPAEAERLLACAATPAERHARGRLRLAQGRAYEALQDLRTGPPRHTALADLVAALLATGRRGEARRTAAEAVLAARRSGDALLLGVALRAAALPADGDRQLRHLGEAAAVLEGSAARLERAKACIALGTALRLAGADEEAREPLRLALGLAHRCGATALEERALAELRAAGARPRRRASRGAAALTPSQLRVAELAAGGRRNLEIAEALFVTPATVEFHLRGAYRTLGIASRTQLLEALAAA
ncbi:MAG TPA: LuxR C-terminal-related transcriptional regulator [Solirubrobacteraceae bacterium]|nr:LuxR C-terminal-related transcriptional regulator [Solirubrobacteraceae bacterium]